MDLVNELIFLCGDGNFSRKFKNSLSIPAKDNQRLSYFSDILHEGLDNYPDEFLKLLRFFINVEKYDYLEALTEIDPKIVFYKYENYNILEYLLFHNLDDEFKKIFSILFSSGWEYDTAVVEQLCDLAMNNEKFDLIYHIYSVIESNNLHTNKTIIQLAVLKDSVEFLLGAIALGFSVNEVTSLYPRYPLIIALAENKSKEIVEILIEHGADTKVTDKETGKSPLDFCEENKELINIINESDGSTIDHMYEDVCKVKEQLELDYRLDSFCAMEKVLSYKHPIIKWKNIDLFYLSLMHHGSIETALDLSEYLNNVEYGNEIIKAMLFVSCNDYETLSDSYSLFSLIIPRIKLNINKEDLLFDIACHQEVFNSFDYDDFEFFFSDLSKVLGLDITYSYRALLKSFACCNINYLKYGIQKGMQPKLLDSYFDGAFYHFIKESSIYNDDLSEEMCEMCQTLIDGGVSVNYQDNVGNTVLHKLINEEYMYKERLHSNIIMALKFGADASIRNFYNTTPADLLIEKNPEMEELYYILKLFEMDSNKGKAFLGGYTYE